MTKVMSATFVLLIFEIILFGPVGIVIFGLPVRKLLIALLLLMSIYQMLIVGRVKTRQLGFLFGLAFFVAIWGALVPLLNGVAPAMSTAEVSPLAGLFLILPIQHLFEKHGPRYYLAAAKWAALVLAVIVTVTWVLANVLGQIDFGLAVRGLYISINQTESGIYVGPMPDGSFRVMVIGCMVFPFLLAYHNWNAFSYRWSAFYLIAIYATGTRAFVLGGVSILVIALLRHRPGAAAVIVVLAITAYPMLSNLGEGKRVFEFASELDEASARYVQFFSLIELFSDHPVFGAGFGAHAAIIRSEYAPFSYELTYVALLAKLGLVGAALVLLSFGKITVDTLMRFPASRANIFGLLIAFILMTATNPYLINSLGITVIAFLISLKNHCTAVTRVNPSSAGRQWSGRVPAV